MIKIAIIGANSNIARSLIKTICDDSSETKLYLYDFQPEHIDCMTEYKNINVFDLKSLESIDFDVDYIYIFTGKTGTVNAFHEYQKFIEINEIALLNILNCAVKNSTRAKIIFPSTRLLYKGSDKKIKENDELEFNTIYGINKFACEKYLELYHKIYGLNYCILRICVPYGSLIESATSYGTLEFMLNKAKSGNNITLFNSGIMRRSLISMFDLCNILLLVAKDTSCLNDIYNVGGEDYSLFEMAKEISKIYNVQIENIEWDKLSEKMETGSTVFDSSKLDSLLHYDLQITFKNWIKAI